MLIPKIRKKRSVKILVVDDELDMRDLLYDILSQSGYEVETAESGEDALMKLDAPGKFQILITDIYMPGISGLELLSKAKRIDKWLEVIVITGFGSIETAVEAMRKGAFDYVNKPVHMEHLKVIVAKTLERSRLRQAARKVKFYRYLSNMDALTQLYNHGAFFQLLDRELIRSKRYSHPLTLLLVDIDYFKQYNDNYGHLAGDRVLSQISLIMKRTSRQMDLIARYGGEEFAIIAPETPKEQAILMAERLRKKIEEAPFEGKGGHLNARLTVSLGLSGYPVDADSAELLVKKADQALYYSKKHGRNQLTVFNLNDPTFAQSFRG
ncbi:MAG: diguanylate cyclase [Candidatus Tectomicrobia bacterium]|uniref:diguanylate cyclase n=1 Tax=Tectimicrobiota bacterium TaxID=2528274 RepID=A0A933GK01_UNCTE|nr:diguanylate cyclase [Candidatus Tectomicrobia bacterium]